MVEATLLGAALWRVSVEGEEGSRVMTVGFGGQVGQVGDSVLAFPHPVADL